MRVLVCGSRSWTNAREVYRQLDLYLGCNPGPERVVIEGNAKGPDRFAGMWADLKAPLLGVQHLQFPAKWNEFGKAAGMIRNQQMLKEGKPDLVLAFWDGKSRGTANMIELAKKAGIEVLVVSPLESTPPESR